MLNSQYDSALNVLNGLENNTANWLTELRKQIADVQGKAIFEMLGIKIGDVVKIKFGASNHDWKIGEADLDGVSIYMVKPIPLVMGSRTLFYEDVRKGKYVISKV